MIDHDHQSIRIYIFNYIIFWLDIMTWLQCVGYFLDSKRCDVMMSFYNIIKWIFFNHNWRWRIKTRRL